MILWIFLATGFGGVVQGSGASAPLTIGGDFGREVLNAAGAAALAQDVAVQGVTATSLSFRGQQQPTLLPENDETHVCLHQCSQTFPSPLLPT